MEVGEFIHIEIGVTDIKKAVKFYTELFGWTIKHESEDYAGFATSGEGLGGGFCLQDTPAPSDGPIRAYIRVDDIPGTLARIAKAGGRTEMEKTSIGPWGFMAQFRDPCGNLMSLWSKT